MAEGELAVPLLGDDQEADTGQQQATGSAQADAQQEGDLEQGLSGAGSDAGDTQNAAEDEATYQVARLARLTGPGIYFGDLFRLCIFYWAIVADVLLLKELYIGGYIALAGAATGFTVGPHVLMSLLLIVRQGWLAAAGQAVGFILTLNPFENLTPIPQGIVGLFMLSIGFIAYVLIAASGLIFVAYCVVCYLVTALLFSLLILDLAAFVITLAPSKAIFKYTDLVYTENFKTSRLVLQAWLQSAPELVIIGIILYRNISTGPAVVVPAPLLLQALIAHMINLWDKSLLFRSCARQSGCSAPYQFLLLLGIRASCRLSMPVLKENLSRVVRGAGGSGGTGLGATIHLTSAEDVPDNDSDAAASMVPEYLTPTNGGLLSPGQLMGLARAVFLRYGGPGVAELVLEITPGVMVGKLLSDALPTVPNVSKLRLVNAGARGADAAALASALLQLGNLKVLQLHQVVLDERGAVALSRLLEATPTLQQLELCSCKLRRRAAVALAQGLRSNRTLRQLNLAGVKGLDEAGAVALADAVGCSKALTALNLAYVELCDTAVDAVVEAIKSSNSLRVVAVSQSSVSVSGGSKLLSTISSMACPKAPPSLKCNLNLGTFSVEGLDSRVQFLVVQDQDSLVMDAWQGLAGPTDLDLGLGGASGLGLQGLSPSAAAAATAGSGSSECEVELESTPLLQPPPTLQLQQQQARQQQQQRPPLSPAAAFGVISPLTGVTPSGSPRAAAAAAGSSSTFGAMSPLHPRASGAAWVSGIGSTGSGSGSPSSLPGTPSAYSHAAAATAASNGSNGSSGASSSKAAAAGRCPSYICPCLVLVVEQQECVKCMVQSPLLFEELDTLDLSGLGIEDQGASEMAKTLSQNPNMRRCILADNKIGEEGGAALAAALAVNTSLQVLDLSSNEFNAEGVGVLADATCNAAGLKQLRLLGNKIPFGLETLRKLMQAEASNPQCHLVLVEDPAEVMDELEAQGDSLQVSRASGFYQHQAEYRQQRRSRMLARQQRRAQALELKAAQQQEQQQQQEQGEEADGSSAGVVATGAAGSAGGGAAAALGGPQAAWVAAAPAAAAAGGTGVVQSSSGSSGPGLLGLLPEHSTDSVASIDGQPLRVVVHSSGSNESGDAAAAGGSSGAPGSSPRGSGSLLSITTDEDTCGICFDNNNHVAIKYCGHRLCVDCYRKVWELSGGGSTCPFCRAKLEGYMYLDWPLE